MTAANSQTYPPRMGKILLKLLVCLSGITFVFACGIYFLYAQLEQSIQVGDSARGEFVVAFKKLDNLYSAALRQHMRDRPLSQTEWKAIVETADYYEDFAARDSEDHEMQAVRARAFELKGQLYAEIGEVKKAEQEFREAQQILATLVFDNAPAEIHIAYASVSNRLSHLLAGMGRIADAREQAIKIICHLERFVLTPEILIELAIACNNHAKLVQRYGDDKTAELQIRKCTEIWRKLAKQAPQNEEFLDRLIDTQQSLVGFLWRTGRYSEAETECHESLGQIARRERLSERTSVELEIVNARAMAEANLRSLQTSIAIYKIASSSGNEMAWAWSPITGRDGKMIRHGAFARGQLPAEFERHDALMLAFSWSSPYVSRADLLRMLASIAKETYRHIQLIVLAPDDTAQQLIAGHFKKFNVPCDKIRFIQLPTNTVWLRDFGPFGIRGSAGQTKMVDAAYSFTRLMDDRVPARLGRSLRMEVVRTSVNLTGGNLLSNGNGLCVTSKKLLSFNAAAGHSEEHVTNTIKRLFGAKQVVYLEPLAGELTGDVDWFAAFTGPDTIVVGDYEGRDPDNTAILNRNADRLQKIITLNGPLKVVRIPMPRREKDFFGGTYTNVVFANKVVLVPTWSDAATEERALEVYRKLLPGWKVVGTNATSIRRGDGAIRCMTMPLFRIPNFVKDVR